MVTNDYSSSGLSLDHNMRRKHTNTVLTKAVTA